MSYTGMTLYGNRVTLPEVNKDTSPQSLFAMAERLGVVRIENHLGDVFRRRAEGRWDHIYTRGKKA